MVVGSGQTGVQLSEELQLAGRDLGEDADLVVASIVASGGTGGPPPPSSS